MDGHFGSFWDESITPHGSVSSIPTTAMYHLHRRPPQAERCMTHGTGKPQRAAFLLCLCPPLGARPIRAVPRRDLAVVASAPARRSPRRLLPSALPLVDPPVPRPDLSGGGGHRTAA